MKARGIDVFALATPGEDLERFAKREDVPVYGVEMLRSISPLSDLVAVYRIVRLIRRIRPHIVHAHTPKGGLLGMIAAWVARVPVRVYHIRGLPLMTASGPKRMLLKWTERIACALANRVLCVSHSIREVATAERLCPPHKIHVLLGGSGNGVDATGRFDPHSVGESARAETRLQYGIPDDALVVGFVGRLVRDKGIVELVEAWQILREELPDLHLLLLGPFEAEDPVPPSVEAVLRQDPRVHLTGMAWETPPLYAAMDLLVLPTYREGFPNSPLEAASMALPVVATRVPGCTDAVADGVTGTLVPSRDAAALTVALRAYLRDPDMRRSHGRAGRERVLVEFRREAVWEALFEEYLDLARRKQLPLPASVAARGALGSLSSAPSN